MILLIEDDPLLRRASGRALRAAGYQVLLAGSVTEALAVLETARGITAIVSDYDLPDGTADDVYQALGLTSLRCILYSGNAEAQIEGWPKFTKPNIQSVIAMLKEWGV